jgi:hypothetical protein
LPTSPIASESGLPCSPDKIRASISLDASIADPILTQRAALSNIGFDAQEEEAALAAITALSTVATVDFGNSAICLPVAGLIADMVSGSVSQPPAIKFPILADV